MTKTAATTAIKPELTEIKENHELIRKLQKYDPDNLQNNGPEFEFLWSEFYETYKKRIYSTIIRMVKNPDSAEEITQVVMLQLVKKIKTFRGDSDFTTWLHRLCVNQTLMQFRKDGTKRQIEISYEKDSLGLPKAEFDARFGYVQHNLDAQWLTLNQVIHELPPGYSKVFFLHDVEGYEHKEVAKLLGITAGTTKSQLHKARTKLMHQLRARARRKPNLAYT